MSYQQSSQCKLTEFGRQDRNVVPFGSFSVQSLQCADGPIVGIDVKQSLQVCVPINGVSETRMTVMNARQWSSDYAQAQGRNVLGVLKRCKHSPRKWKRVHHTPIIKGPEQSLCSPPNKSAQTGLIFLQTVGRIWFDISIREQICPRQTHWC